MTISLFANREDLIGLLKDLSVMDVNDERNTAATLSMVFKAVMSLGLLSENAICKRFVIDSNGLKRWMSDEYFIPDSSRPRIYHVILEEIESSSAA